MNFRFLNKTSPLRLKPPKELLHFQGRDIEIVRRRFRRRVKLSIDIHGRTRLFTSYSLSYVEMMGFLNENSEWILNKWSKLKELRKKIPQKKFEHGETFLFLGMSKTLVVQPTESTKARVQLNGDRLVCDFPATLLYRSEILPSLIREMLLSFYKNQAHEVLRRRTGYWSEKMNLRPKKLTLRAQKTRWGSCSTRGHISLNWKLIGAPPEVIDYVIIHELAHLEHPNHSPRFWALVEKFAPEMNHAKKWLRKNHYELDFLFQTTQ